MVDTKEIVDIFLKSEITTISNFDSYKVSRLGGITNVNFKVEIGSQKFVLRLPGKNPDTSLNRESEKNNQLVAVEAGLTLPFHWASNQSQFCQHIPLHRNKIYRLFRRPQDMCQIP